MNGFIYVSVILSALTVRYCQLSQDRHSHTRRYRQLQQCNEAIDFSDDDHSISECSLESDHKLDSNYTSEYLCASGTTNFELLTITVLVVGTGTFLAAQ